MNLSDFFNVDFKTYSNLDNVRSLPSVVDGLKDSQRKAVYGMIHHGNSEIKVSQLGAKTALLTHYNHGEVSMCDTIVGLAQRFPGSNNVNVFEPVGQFGSILSSESGAHRYIFTKPSQWLNKLFRPEDNCVLQYRYEDGDKAEPFLYYPIVPLWAINGTSGIGTGHSTKILPRKLSDVTKAIIDIANGKKPKRVDPHLEGWKGSCTVEEPGKYVFKGILEKVNTTTLQISELPFTYDVDRYKEILIGLLNDKQIKDYDNNSTEHDGFSFTVSVAREVGKKPDTRLIKMFKLEKKITENYTLWNPDGQIVKYETFEDALADFVKYRLQRYGERIHKQVHDLFAENDYLLEKQKFIEAWNSLDRIRDLTEDRIGHYMCEDIGLTPQYVHSFLDIPVKSLTIDRIQKLKEQIAKNEARIDELTHTTEVGALTAELKTL